MMFLCEPESISRLTKALETYKVDLWHGKNCPPGSQPNGDALPFLEDTITHLVGRERIFLLSSTSRTPPSRVRAAAMREALSTSDRVLKSHSVDILDESKNVFSHGNNIKSSLIYQANRIISIVAVVERLVPLTNKQKLSISQAIAQASDRALTPSSAWKALQALLYGCHICKHDVAYIISKHPGLLSNQIDLRESRLESGIEAHEREVESIKAELERDRHTFEQHMAEQEAQFAKDAKAHAEERCQIAKEWQKIAEERQVLAENTKQVTERERNLLSEREMIEQLHRESTMALNNADRMKKEVGTDREILESREKRVLQLQKEAEALQTMVSEKNLIVSSALEKAAQRESAAALKLQEAETMMQQAAQMKENAENKISQWEKEVHESREKEKKAVQAVENVKQDTLILQKSMESLKDLENHLQEREWKLHETWKAIKTEAYRTTQPALNEPGNTLCTILELDTLNKDGSAQ